MNDIIFDLLNYLDHQKYILTLLKDRLLGESDFCIEDLRDIESILQSNRKCLDVLLVWFRENIEILEIHDKFYEIQIKLINNLSFIKGILSIAFDLIVQLDVFDESL